MGLTTLRTLLLGAFADTGSEVDEMDREILRATLVCLGRHGTDRMSVADIASRAGVGRATVFRRFETKSELIRRAFAWELRTILTQFQAAADELDDPAERTTEWLVCAVRIIRTHPVARRIATDGNASEILGDQAIAQMLTASIETQLRHTLRGRGAEADILLATELISRFFVSTWLAPGLGSATGTDEGVRRIAASMLDFLLSPLTERAATA